jgi:hypothetical protein
MTWRPSCSDGGIQASPHDRDPDGRDALRAIIALTLALALGSCGGEDATIRLVLGKSD